jgi:hypothetical protein
MSNETQIEVSRTLVMSEPELRELVEVEPRLEAPGVRVSFAEKGFGTRVSISASAEVGIEEAELEQILDQLSEPQKRPFSAD